MFSVKLEDNENLVAVFRQAEWVLAKTILIIFVGIYIPWSIIFKYELPQIFIKIMAIWSIACLLYFIYKLVLWFINCTILTDKRIILVKYPGVFHRILEDFNLDDIVGIAIEKKGIWRSMFDIGQLNFTLRNQPAGKILLNQKNPEKLKSTILNSKNIHSP